MMVPDNKWLWIFAVGIFVAALTMGYSIATAAFRFADVQIIPKGFTCTESAIVNGAAECVKYERREQ